VDCGYSVMYTIFIHAYAQVDIRSILSLETVSETVHAQVSILVTEPGDEALRQAASYPPQPSSPDSKEQAVAQWVLEHCLSAGKGTEVLREASQLIFSVKNRRHVQCKIPVAMPLTFPSHVLSSSLLQGFV
jgi:K+-sensing histidine kinase KdpD